MVKSHCLGVVCQTLEVVGYCCRCATARRPEHGGFCKDARAGRRRTEASGRHVRGHHDRALPFPELLRTRWQSAVKQRAYVRVTSRTRHLDGLGPLGEFEECVCATSGHRAAPWAPRTITDAGVTCHPSIHTGTFSSRALVVIR